MVTSRPTDRRVRRTLRALQDAFLELVAEKGYDAVTVSDVIDRADVGRSTFYSHYTDKADLLQDCLATLESLIRPSAPHTGSPFGFSLPLLQHVDEQRPRARALISRSNAPVVQRIEELVLDTVRAELATLPASPVPAEARARAATGSFLALLTWWLNDDEPYTPEQLNEIFQTLMTTPTGARAGTLSALASAR